MSEKEFEIDVYYDSVTYRCYTREALLKKFRNVIKCLEETPERFSLQCDIHMRQLTDVKEDE